MLTFLLSAVIVIALSVALVAWLCILQGVEYDKWLAEFESNPEAKAVRESRGLDPLSLCAVLDGREVVGYTSVVERRSNRL
jgi:hypothetical protein